VQKSLFANTQDPILQELRDLDLGRATQEEVLSRVRRWQREVRG